MLVDVGCEILIMALFLSFCLSQSNHTRVCVCSFNDILPPWSSGCRRASAGASSREGDPRPTRCRSGLSRRGSFAEDDEDTSVLAAMGFSGPQIRDALSATDGCLQSAIELLLA